MLVIFPIATADKPRRQPMATLGIILFALAANAVARLGGLPFLQIVDRWGYIPNEGSLATFLSNFILQREIWLLGVNLWILYVFGPLLESRIGHLPLVLLFLAGGLVSTAMSGGLDVGSDRMTAHVGTSGAIGAILGFFLVLYPFSDLKVWYMVLFLYWGFKAGVMRTMALLFVGLWLFIHLVNLYLEHITGEGYTDILATLSGFAFGIVVGIFGYGREGLLRDTTYED